MAVISSFSKLTPMFVFVGFQIFVFSLASIGKETYNSDDDILGCMISGYVAYIIAFVLSTGFYMGGLEKNKIGRVSVIVFALAAGILIIAGMGVHGDRYEHARAYAYPNTLLASSALLAILGGVCGIIYLIRD